MNYRSNQVLNNSLWFWAYTDPLDEFRMEQEAGLQRLREQIMAGSVELTPTDLFWVEKDISEDREGFYR